MFSYAPASPPGDLPFCGTDEELMLFLAKSKNGISLPANVTTDVNPFSVEPWKTSEKKWFLCNFVNSFSGQGRKTKDVGPGYWKEAENDTKLFPNSLNEGSKITWEFYIGVAPAGYRTDWAMLEFRRESKKDHEDNVQQQDFSSLCCVYRCRIPSHVSEEEHNNFINDNVEVNHLQSILLNIEEDEENIQSPNLPNESEVGHRGEQHQSPSTWKHNLAPANPTALHFSCNFCEGDFLELNDFDDLESSSSSSDNSSHASRTSDEYFDSELLLQTLQNPSNEITGQDVAYSKQDNCGSDRSVQVDKDVKSPVSQLMICHSSSPYADGRFNSSGVRDDDHTVRSTASSSVVPLDSNENTSLSRKSKGYKAKRAASQSPQSAGNSQGSGAPVSRTIAKLSKKYCCFGPFQTCTD